MSDLEQFLYTLKKIGLPYTCRSVRAAEGEFTYVGFTDMTNNTAILYFVDGQLG